MKYKTYEVKTKSKPEDLWRQENRLKHQNQKVKLKLIIKSSHEINTYRALFYDKNNEKSRVVVAFIELVEIKALCPDMDKAIQKMQVYHNREGTFDRMDGQSNPRDAFCNDNDMVGFMHIANTNTEIHI